MLIWLTITHFILYAPSHGSMHLIGLNKMSAHMMGYEPMIKILSTFISIDQLVKPRLIMPQSLVLIQ